MLKPYPLPIHRLAFVHGYAGPREAEQTALYAVAAILLAPEAPVRRFTSLLRHPFLTERERRLSRLGRNDTADAPPPAEARARLREFLEDPPFVLVLNHAGQSDALCRFCGASRWVDLAFAAEFFYPFLETATLPSLWRFLHGRDRPRLGFTSLEAAELSLELVRHICGFTLNDGDNVHAPALRHALGRSETLFGALFVHLASHYGRYFPGLLSPDVSLPGEDWKAGFRREAAKTPLPPSRRKTAGAGRLDLTRLYEGLTAAARGFQPRPSQLAYARAVDRALREEAVLTIEAGTGTGKTQGYLLPVLSFLAERPQAGAIISTYTKNLQDQLFHRELPLARQADGSFERIPVALLRGKSNHVCLEKLDQILDDDLRGDRILLWLYLFLRAAHFRQVDREGAGPLVRRHLETTPLLRLYQNETSARTGCPAGHRACPAQISLAEARAARLVVTNHHKLAVMDQDEDWTNDFPHVVIDEANHFEQAVRNALSVTVTSQDLSDCLFDLEGLLLKALRRTRKRSPAPAEAWQEALRKADRLRMDVTAVGRLLRALHPHARFEDPHPLPAFSEAAPEGSVATFLDGVVQRALRLCALVASPARQQRETVRATSRAARAAGRLGATSDRLRELASDLQAVALSLGQPDVLATCQVGTSRWVLASSPIDVGDPIRRILYARKQSVVFTSATLRWQGEFDDFRRIMGMDAPDGGEASGDRSFRFAAVPSPFRPDVLEILVPEHAESGRYDNKAAWCERVASLLPELIRQNGGRTLVLFSSHADIQRIGSRVGNAVDAMGFPLLVQTPGAPTTPLMEEFRLIPESVLFGADTFWYGVDFPGETLTQVIITRIPYPHPFDPLQIARKRLLGEAAARKRYLYDTMIKIKQGMGRLIRSEKDKGRVVVLDARFRPAASRFAREVLS